MPSIVGPPDARQRLRARDAEPTAVSRRSGMSASGGRLPTRSTASCSRARSSTASLRSRTARSSRCRGHTPTRSPRYAYDPAAGRTRLLDDAGWRRGAGRRSAQRDGGRSRSRSSRRPASPSARTSRRRSSGSFATSASTRPVAADRWHLDQLALVRREVRRDAALVADAGRSRAHAVLRARPHAAGGRNINYFTDDSLTRCCTRRTAPSITNT